MKLIYGCCFSDNEHYSTKTGEISGWDLIHKYIDTKLHDDHMFKLVRYNISDKNSHYCLTLKLYNEDRYCLSIPYMQFINDSHQIDLNHYFDFLSDCGLKNVEERYSPTFMVIH